MRSVVMVLGLAVLAPSITNAQDIEWRAPETPTDSDLAAARDAYARGLAALEQGDAADALEEFRASYTRSGVLAALFNAAHALVRLGRYVEALAALDELDRRGTPPDVAASAEELRTDVRARIAHLTVLDVPPRATVTIDDRPIPVEATIEHAVDPGEHALRVSQEGRDPFVWRGALLAGERRSVRVDFASAGGGVDVGEVALIVGLTVGAAVLIAGIATGAVIADRDAQLAPSAPTVFRFP
jgi:pentatricopeptide repeat protein